MKFSAAVLAGGQSSRFGRDKARHIWHGKPLLRWVLDSLIEADERFVVANRLYEEFGLPTYADAIAGGDSLSGIHSALVHAQSEWVAVAACDLPKLVPEYWRYLFSQTDSDVQVVAGVGPGGLPEPLAAFYHRSMISEIEGRLYKGDLKLQSIFASVPTTLLPWAGLQQFGSDLYLNANRLTDLTPPKS